MLAPNVWKPAERAWTTVVAVDESYGVCVRVTATRSRVRATSQTELTSAQREFIRHALRRMLRLDEDLSPFHDLCRRSKSHRRAADIRFGRLLRSATLFEDVVKVICTCNVGWSQTVGMVDRLVRQWGIPTEDANVRSFPTPAKLSRVRESTLKRQARLGYRAAFVHRFARDVVDGRLDLHALETFDGPSDDLYRRLREIHGVGDYAAANLCMLLGRYDRLAIDTELKRFVQEKDPSRPFTAKAVRDAYAPWHPYQFLAYWYELWSGYTDRHGDADQWQADDTGRRITRPAVER